MSGKPQRAASITWGLLFAVLAGAAGPARTDAASERSYSETRVVLGVMVSGAIVLHAGIEHEFSEHQALRLELLRSVTHAPAANFGYQISLQQRWTLSGESAAEYSPRGREGTLSAGVIQLFVREKKRGWRNLLLWHLSPGYRWGLGEDAGSLGVEVPVCWYHKKHKILPIGFQFRWRAD